MALLLTRAKPLQSPALMKNRVCIYFCRWKKRASRLVCEDKKREDSDRSVTYCPLRFFIEVVMLSNFSMKGRQMSKYLWTKYKPASVELGSLQKLVPFVVLHLQKNWLIFGLKEKLIFDVLKIRINWRYWLFADTFVFCFVFLSEG